MHRLPELRADLVEMECDPREGLDHSDSDDEVWAVVVLICCSLPQHFPPADTHPSPEAPSIHAKLRISHSS